MSPEHPDPVYQEFINDPLVQQTLRNFEETKEIEARTKEQLKQLKEEQKEFDRIIDEARKLRQELGAVEEAEEAILSGKKLSDDHPSRKVVEKYATMEKLKHIPVSLSTVLDQAKVGFKDIYDSKTKQMLKPLSVMKGDEAYIIDRSDRLTLISVLGDNLTEAEAKVRYTNALNEIKQTLQRDGKWQDKGEQLLSIDSTTGQMYAKDRKFIVALDFCRDLKGKCEVRLEVHMKKPE